jgi:hypothetical protein
MCGWCRESCSANVCSKFGAQFLSFPPLSLLDINHDDDQRPGMRFSISWICPRCLQIPNMQQFCWKFCFVQMENSAIEEEPSASSLDHSFRIIWISSWSNNTFHHLSPSLLAYKSILIESEMPETSPFDIVTFVLLGLFLDSLSYELLSFAGSWMK